MNILLLNLYIYIWLAMAGACVGSFLNVVVYRLPKGEFFAEPRSHCPACGAQLRWRDLIPVLSWLLLKGRCRYCGAKISPRYPLVEAAGAALALLCYARYGLSPRLALAFGAVAILLAVALIDHDTMEIPDALIVALIPFAIGAIWVWPAPLMGRVIGFFIISLPLSLLALLIEGAFGGGDIKLMAVCGFLLSWPQALAAFMLALLTGGGYAVFLLLSGRAKRGAHIAFGPHLCWGVAAALLWGTEIIRSYLNLFM